MQRELNMMKKLRFLLIVTLSLVSFIQMNSIKPISATNALPVYRVYNPNSGEHLHTLNYNESVYLAKIGWIDEGISMYAVESGDPLYRLYNPNSGEHFYTLNWNEQVFLSKHGWKYEGIAWYTPKTGTPMYRVFNPNAHNAGSHHYTASQGERDSLVRIGWKNENIAWYSAGAPVSKYVSSRVYAHMGSKERLEHTFEGYDLAISQGSKIVDQDLVISKNGTFWVSHDDSAKRVFGVDKKFQDMTDNEIRNLSYLQSPNTKILTFEDVVKKYGKSVKYSVEIKTGHENLSNFINILRKYNIPNNVIFSSFPETNKPEPNRVFRVMKQTFPNIETMAVITNQAHLYSIVNAPYLDTIAIYSPLLSQGNVDLAHRNGKKVVVWVLNTKDEIKNALIKGVDGYYTDFTKLGIEVEKNLFQ